MKKSKLFLGLAAICALGTIGGAFALTHIDKTTSGDAGAFDQAIYLNWASDSPTATLAAVEGLTNSAAQYRYLTVAPKSTKSVSGTVTLSFTLAASGATNHVNGLTIKIYNTASLANDSNVDDLIAAQNALKVTLDSSHLTGSTTFEVATSSAAHETEAYYAIETSWTGANDTDHPTYTLGGTLTIAQSFAAA